MFIMDLLVSVVSLFLSQWDIQIISDIMYISTSDIKRLMKHPEVFQWSFDKSSFLKLLCRILEYTHWTLTVHWTSIYSLIIYKCGHRNVLSKRQVWVSIFHIINFKKKIMDTGSWICFNKKLILDYYFCLKSGPVFLFQIFIIGI